MTMSGSPKEPKNEQQAAGHNQSSCRLCAELAVMGYSSFRVGLKIQKKERSGLQFACDELIDKGAIHTGA
jgi:hypothetical protein